MKKSTLISLMTATMLSGCLCAQAQGQMTIQGEVFNVDTVGHFKIGPGTTTTSLKLSGPRKLNVHYLTINRHTPGVKFRAVNSGDKQGATEATSSMAKRNSNEKQTYFAGINGDFYETSGNAANGASMVGTPYSTTIVDGEFHRAFNNGVQMMVDVDGKAYVDTMDYNSGTISIGDKVASFKGVNTQYTGLTPWRADGVILYTPKHYGVTNQTDYTGNSWEVTAKLVEGDSFTAGGKYRMEITSDPNESGNTTIPADGFVIHGHGTSLEGHNTSGLDFVKGLKTGDIVEFDQIVLVDGLRVFPQNAISGFPKLMNNGVTRSADEQYAERGDASGRHPRSSVGHSQTGDSIIFMVVEGRSANSVGVTTPELGDIMKYAGAWEATNIDGGGSSTLYTSSFGIRNVCSDGKERSNGNAFFASIDHPTVETEITEIRFQDWVGKIPKYANYTPRILGFNKYGVLVNDSVTGYTLTCPAELGEINNNGETLFANGDGSHLLKAELNGITTEIVVKIDNNMAFKERLSSILIDDVREYPIELLAHNGWKSIDVASYALSWSSADTSIATISEDGVLKGVANGTTTITGVVGEQTVTVTVNVEIPRAPKENIMTNFDVEAWKFTKGGCNNTSTVLTATAEGAKIDYKVSSTRGLALTLAPAEDMFLWSLPTAMELIATPTGQQLKSAKINFTDNNAGRFAASSEAVAAGEKITYRINLTDYTNLNDIAVFPIKLGSIVFTPDAKSGATGAVDIHALNIIYGDGAGVDDIISDKTGIDNNIPPVYYNLQGIRVDNPTNGLYIERRGNKAIKVIR